MHLRPVVRRVSLVVAVLALLGLAWNGVWGGLHQIPQSHTTGQWVQTIAQLGFGVFGLLGVLTTVWGARWRPLVLTGWVVSVAVAAGFASVVWGGSGPGVGLLSAAASAGIALVVVWLLRVGLAD